MLCTEETDKRSGGALDAGQNMLGTKLYNGSKSEGNDAQKTDYFACRPSFYEAKTDANTFAQEKRPSGSAGLSRDGGIQVTPPSGILMRAVQLVGGIERRTML